MKGLKRTRNRQQLQRRQRWYHLLEKQQGTKGLYAYNQKPYFLRDKTEKGDKEDE